MGSRGHTWDVRGGDETIAGLVVSAVRWPVLPLGLVLD